MLTNWAIFFLQINIFEEFKDTFNEYPILRWGILIFSTILSIIILFNNVFNGLDSSIANFKKVFNRLIFWKKDREEIEDYDDILDPNNFMSLENPKGYYVDEENRAKSLRKCILKYKSVCVFGPSGVGKTRLVQQVCCFDIKEEFPISVYVDFESIGAIGTEQSNNEIFDSARVKIDEALGVDRNENYSKIVKCFQKPTILFIDNYEQIKRKPELHKEIYKRIIKPFVVDNPKVHVVITSQVEINELEYTFTVNGLSNVNSSKGYALEELSTKFEAIKLFCKLFNSYQIKKSESELDSDSGIVDRIDFNRDEFDIIIELCNSVSNLPLGIRLLACNSLYYDLKSIKNGFEQFLEMEIPSIFGDLTDKQKNIYKAFNYSLDSFDEEEKSFYYNLTFFEDAFYAKSLPSWPVYKNEIKTTQTVIKLEAQSLLRKQLDPAINKPRYEMYALFREMIKIKQKENDFTPNIEFQNDICLRYRELIDSVYNFLYNKNRETFNYKEVKVLKNEKSNIDGIIEWLTGRDNDLATELLVKLESILDIVGPYTIKNNLYEPLLKHYKSGPNRILLLLSKARLLKSSKERNTLIGPLKEALDLAEKENRKDKILGEAYRTGVILAGEVSRFDIVDDILKKVEGCSEEEKKHIGYLNYSFLIVGLAKKMERDGNHDLAEKYFEEAIGGMKGYTFQRVRAMNYFAIYLWRRGLPLKSENLFKQAIEIFEGVGEDRWILAFKTNLGLLYCEMGRLDLSLEYTNAAFESLEKRGPYGWFLNNKLNQGRVYARKACSGVNFKKAESLLLEATNEMRAIEYWESMVLGETELTELYLKYDKYIEASNFAKIGIKDAIEFKVDKLSRYFRLLCMSGLISLKNESKIDASVFLEKAESFLATDKDKPLLNYEINWLRYSQLKKALNKDD